MKKSNNVKKSKKTETTVKITDSVLNDATKKSGLYSRDRWGRWTIAGKPLPSVTTIIGMKAKPMLYGWYYKNCAHADINAYALGKIATGIGTDVHNYAELFWDGKGPTVKKGTEAFNCVNNFHRAVDYLKPTKIKILDKEGNEQRVVFINTDDVGYAGELDEVWLIGDELYIIDYKTSKAIYHTDVWYQLEAYTRALNDMLFKGTVTLEGTDQKRVENYGIIRLPKEGKINFKNDVWLQEGLTDEVFVGFLGLLDAYNTDKWIRQAIKGTKKGKETK